MYIGLCNPVHPVQATCSPACTEHAQGCMGQNKMCLFWKSYFTTFFENKYFFLPIFLNTQKTKIGPWGVLLGGKVGYHLNKNAYIWCKKIWAKFDSNFVDLSPPYFCCQKTS